MPAIPSLLLLFISLQVLWTLGATAEERRSDVRAVLGEIPEPGFWPARGRRSDTNFPTDLFWSQRNHQYLPIVMCGDSQLLTFCLDPRYGVQMKENSQLKSWTRA